MQPGSLALQVFKPCLKVRSLTASKLAGELVATSEGQARLAVDLHCRLLEIVRGECGCGWLAA